MERPSLQLLSECISESPSFDTAVSHALLRRVAAHERSASLRLYRPPDAVVFSQLDRLKPGFASAVEHAREEEFGACVRLAGGHAAVFHARTLAFAWTLPLADSRLGIRQRFRETADWIVRALRELAVDARVGEVEGEYCPGAFSVNARGRRKLAGIGQRVIRGAAHVGGVIVMDDGNRIGRVLELVYRDLDLPFRPDTVGSVLDERSEAASCADVEAALIESLRTRYDAAPAEIGAETLALACQLEERHRAG